MNTYLLFVFRCALSFCGSLVDMCVFSFGPDAAGTKEKLIKRMALAHKMLVSASRCASVYVCGGRAKLGTMCASSACHWQEM